MSYIVTMKTFDYEAKLWYGWDKPKKPVTDGDTIWFLIDQGTRNYHASDFRILDYDAPETRGAKTRTEYLHGKLATVVAEELLVAEGPLIKIITHDKGKYGRWLAEILLERQPLDYVGTMKSLGLEKQRPYPKELDLSFVLQLGEKVLENLPASHKTWMDEYVNKEFQLSE